MKDDEAELNKIKSEAVEEFCLSLIDAYETNFIDQYKIPLDILYRHAQSHCQLSYGVKLPFVEVSPIFSNT